MVRLEGPAVTEPDGVHLGLPVTKLLACVIFQICQCVARCGSFKADDFAAGEVQLGRQTVAEASSITAMSVSRVLPRGHAVVNAGACSQTNHNRETRQSCGVSLLAAVPPGHAFSALQAPNLVVEDGLAPRREAGKPSGFRQQDGNGRAARCARRGECRRRRW
jgi:hypothetical protein